jgi:ribosome-associated protein
MDIRKLQRAIVDGLEDVKAQNIVVFNTEHLSALFERVIIASGTSNRQTKSLASSVREAVKGAGYPVPRTEGEGNGEWIIVDCGAAVVHVMQPTIRDYYHLEEIWGGKPVNIKLASIDRKLAKAEEPEAPTKKAAAKKTATKKAPARTAAATPAAKKAPAKKPAANLAAKPGAKPRAKPGAQTAVRTATARPPAAKSPARKPPAKQLVATKTMVVGRPPAKKAAPVRGGVTRVTGVKSAARGASKPATKKAPARKTTSRA